MTLKHLFNIHGSLDWRDRDPQSPVSGLCCDSRKVKPKSVYVAISGYRLDGHRFIKEAIQRGAIALVVENPSSIPASFKGAVLTLPDTRQALQILSERFFQSPGDQMTAIAVTGTNGKTSSAYLLEFFLNQDHRNCGLIGTIDCHFREKIWPTELTTPDPITLQKRLKDFLALGAGNFIIEVSSHALSQNRVNQGFEVCLFTNLSRDHLDYHKDMEDYFLSKAKLFSDKMIKKNKDAFAVINGDDPYGLRLKNLCHSRKVFLFGQNRGYDFTFRIKDQSLDSTEIHLSLPSGEKLDFFSPLIGEHNAYNVVGSLACAYVLGLNLHSLTGKLSRFKGVPGRLQLYKSPRGVYSFIDYAHTPEALNRVLSFLHSHKKPGQKLITVFGCGGNRDPGKRPLMGQVAQKYSDCLVITSDNPRTEDPHHIIRAILKGLSPKDSILEMEPKMNNKHRLTPTQKDFPVQTHPSQLNLPVKAFGKGHETLNRIIVEPDRALAIKKAVKMAGPGDIILVAGKGHENCQILDDKKIEFRDDEKILEAFNQGKTL